ncbi:ribosomal-protein-alanine N-acetyltransferase [Actinobacteria bacterium YIM 96077]|uniref:Ribosomal-protein-alanine N-acetyltransferase n=2 Tax=Phytoactinopolyspora halophila TaxID=1981511 RepID=A0A329QM03_9ACTN|nr:ribosomal-protein-alanine N-acetyltransferase [Actinobacteria bacterium YIM 96077]RAW11598.1 ribosomal-protein-alanine N-acetyltransferase [Phytoactinopolyspora halophila]
MRLGDIDGLLPLERELFAGDPPWTAEIFRSELTDMPGTRWYVVAEEYGGRQVVGYAGLRLPAVAGEPADVHTIAVASDWQRHGLGSRLMDMLIEEAVAHRAGSIMLEVRSDNEAALDFYADYGFQRLAVRPAYFHGGRDALVLRKSLDVSTGERSDESDGDNRCL